MPQETVYWTDSTIIGTPPRARAITLNVLLTARFLSRDHHPRDSAQYAQ
jgi:hypothetical protein